MSVSGIIYAAVSGNPGLVRTVVSTVPLDELTSTLVLISVYYLDTHTQREIHIVHNVTGVDPTYSLSTRKHRRWGSIGWYHCH